MTTDKSIQTQIPLDATSNLLRPSQTFEVYFLFFSFVR